MQALERENRQQLIRLYRKEKDRSKEGQQEAIITLNLSKWRLLAYGGAYWVFHHPQTQQTSPHSTTPINYQQPGQFILRTRQLKPLLQLASLRSKFIQSSLIIGNSNNYSITIGSQMIQFQSELEKQPMRIGEMLCEEREEPVRRIINNVYGRFLQTCALQQQQQPMLGQVSKCIVRQSQPYSLQDPNIYKKEPSKSAIKPTVQFIIFLLKQLIYNQIYTKLHLQQSSTNVDTASIDRIIAQHFEKYPLDIDKVIDLWIKQMVNRRGKQLVVTFQRNLMHLNYCQIKTSCNNITIGEVFEFKPKTILPDIYTQAFLQQFVDRYQHDDDVKRLIQRNQQKIPQEQDCDNLLRVKMKQMIIQEIQKTTTTTTKDINNVSVDMRSTRWFKKSCLLKGKKKMMNENPIAYFGICLTNNKHNNYNQVAIDYYNKKHLRKLQLLQVHTIQPYIDHKQLHHQQQQQQSLHEKIISLIGQNLGIDNKLSLVEQILALQLIDVVQQIESNGERQRYMDAIRLSCVARELKSSVRMCKQEITNYKSQCVEETIYPTNAIENIGKTFRPQVYSKARQLSSLLRQIVFQSKQIDQEITKAFSIHHQANQISDLSKTRIKTQMFQLVKFLISLTWKDVSILIQQTFSINRYQTVYSTQQNYAKNKVDINKILIDKQLIKQLQLEASQSSNLNIQRKIVDCGIIDYGIKTIQNIERNVEKDCQFLKNYLSYKMSLEQQG